ncbi:MAG: DUF952 domain-containing protein [Hyphomicrobiaceae bacterium]|nr:DUF952 domain-containing protein [Hyphomicrobiaceae bacterium]
MSDVVDEQARRYVYKILPAAEWADAEHRGSYGGSRDDQRDGFIHLSAADQVAGTVARHFKGQGDLVLVTFPAAALGAALVWEPSRRGALFPHLYGPLPAAAAIGCVPLALGADGVPVVPEGLLR